MSEKRKHGYQLYNSYSKKKRHTYKKFEVLSSKLEGELKDELTELRSFVCGQITDLYTEVMNENEKLHARIESGESQAHEYARRKGEDAEFWKAKYHDLKKEVENA